MSDAEILQVNGKLNKKITITAALPYAKGEIHFGHITPTYLPPDIFARDNRLKGYDVVRTSSIDGFDTPLLIGAEKVRRTSGPYVAYWNKRDCVRRCEGISSTHGVTNSSKFGAGG